MSGTVPPGLQRREQAPRVLESRDRYVVFILLPVRLITLESAPSGGAWAEGQAVHLHRYVCKSCIERDRDKLVHLVR